MPYLYRAAVEAHERGIPMLRAMMFEFPDDPACDYLDLQYMLGDSLLVAPVFHGDGNVSYYLPEGKWTHLLDGRIVEGPRWMRETYGFLSLPLWVRSNSVIPLGRLSDKPDYDYSDGVTLQVYQLQDGKEARVEIPNLDGSIETTFIVRREGKSIQIQRQGLEKPWNLLLVGTDAAENVENAKLINDSTLIESPGETDHLSIRLK
jgi:alpha-D-xyloside xylohydrolase